MANLFSKISLVLLFLSCLSAFAYDGEIHDTFTKRFFFGNKDVALSGDDDAKIDVLNKASYLYLDFFDGGEKKAKRYLAALGMSDISLEEIRTPAGTMFDRGRHQKYTHLGWDEERYGEVTYRNARNIRQNKIMLRVVGRVFPGATLKQREMMGRLIYYTHILGDHEGDSKGSSKHRIPLIPWYESRNDNYTIYSELIKIIKGLPRNSYSEELIRFLKKNSDGKYLCRDKCDGHEIKISCPIYDKRHQDDEQSANIYCFAAKTSDELAKYLPKILADIDFFRDAFPSYFGEGD